MNKPQQALHTVFKAACASAAVLGLAAANLAHAADAGNGKVLADSHNCAACHGLNAQGGLGFPNLTTASWLWGGDPGSIAETIRVGINSAHPQTRTSQMMAFGRDNMLKSDEVDNVVAYVRSLSDPAVAKDVPAAKIDAGKAVFAAN